MSGIPIGPWRAKKRTSAGLRQCPDCGGVLRAISIRGGGLGCEIRYECRLGHCWVIYPARHLIERGLPPGPGDGHGC
jgi:hypothetical protein